LDRDLVVNINGGLGNQMFQYAMGYSLAHDKNMVLKLDISWFNNMGNATPRNFELKIFDKNIEYAENVVINQKNFVVRKLKLNRLWDKFIKPKYDIINEPYFHYWKEFNNIDMSSYLIGYWQSERYFKHNRDLILRIFSFPEISEPHNVNFEHEINKYVDSISLHVRRGDYVLDKHTNSYHGTCNMDYYKNSMTYLSKELENPHFFIFSDDPDWVTAEFSGDNITVIRGNDSELSFRDMQLMTICKHHIVANSSFSWWGTWLSKKEGITVAPRQWFADSSINTDDLYCSDWIRI
jgi:hypothetical protein